MARFASNKRAIAECDICGFQYKLRDLRDLIEKGRNTNLKACNECWNPDHPQLKLGEFPVDDPQAIEDPRPDRDLENQRDFQYGFNPVGFNNPLDLEGLEDDLKAAGQVGSVSVTT